MRPLLYLAACAALGSASAGSAQLISERVVDGARLCTYYGSELSPNDEIVARTLTVGFGENCPAVPPARSPTDPVPGNAAFVREAIERSNRVCIYAQGGRDYRLAVPISQLCPVTPGMRARR